MHSHLLQPLTVLTSNKVKFKWTDVEQKAFDEIKRAVAQDTLLVHPDLNRNFDIHTYAIYYQLGAVIIQKAKPIAFYSHKLSGLQTRCTVTEEKLIIIVKTLKEYLTILLGQKLKIFTDHKNLTYKNFNKDCVLRWRLKIEEYIPEIEYTPGKKNIVADALSGLPNKGNQETTHESTYTTDTML